MCPGLQSFVPRGCIWRDFSHPPLILLEESPRGGPLRAPFPLARTHQSLVTIPPKEKKFQIQYYLGDGKLPKGQISSLGRPRCLANYLGSWDRENRFHYHPMLGRRQVRWSIGKLLCLSGPFHDPFLHQMQRYESQSGYSSSIL